MPRIPRYVSETDIKGGWLAAEVTDTRTLSVWRWRRQQLQLPENYTVKCLDWQLRPLERLHPAQRCCGDVRQASLSCCRLSVCLPLLDLMKLVEAAMVRDDSGTLRRSSSTS